MFGMLLESGHQHVFRLALLGLDVSRERVVG
jgi:hypothetical protein